MSILCTHPGRHGDLLWSLPTIRAIKAQNPDQDIDLVVSAKYEGLVPLLRRQPYLREVVALKDWEVAETAPISPRIPPTVPFGYETVVHLGYAGWPSGSLPEHVYRTADLEHPFLPMAPLDLTTPWITAPWQMPSQDVTVGFTDEWFELKLGLLVAMRQRFIYQPYRRKEEGKTILSMSTSPRWQAEAEEPGWTWESAASWIGTSKVFVGCCSALHVLAAGLGVPVVCIEPNPQRHQSVFYPLDPVQVRLVTGMDGLPTFDVRHLGDAIEAVWQRQEVARYATVE